MSLDIYCLGDLPLENGEILHDARITYALHGQLASDRHNVVLCPTFFGGGHTGYDWLTGSGQPLDANRHCVVAPGLFGNGFSSSPSNHPSGYRCPAISSRDRVVAQHHLVTGELGAAELALVTGWSMGATHAYQCAVSHPQLVARLAPICGSATTSGAHPGFPVRARLCAARRRAREAAAADGGPGARGLDSLPRILGEATLPGAGVCRPGCLSHRLLGRLLHQPERRRPAGHGRHLGAQRRRRDPRARRERADGARSRAGRHSVAARSAQPALRALGRGRNGRDHPALRAERDSRCLGPPRGQRRRTATSSPAPSAACWIAYQ